MSGVSGDFSKLGKLASKIAKLPQTPTQIAPAVAARWSERTMGYFASKVSPYGDAWPPAGHGKPLLSIIKRRRRSRNRRAIEESERLARRTGKAHTTHAAHSLLVASGALRGGVKFIPVTGLGIRFSMAGVEYARYQISARGRRFAPKPNRKPLEWEKDIEEIGGAAMRKALVG